MSPEKKCLVRFDSQSPRMTKKIGSRFSKLLAAGSVIALEGSLGSGKTVFVQGLAQGLNVKEPVTSPTFALIQEHSGNLPLCHADLYRLSFGEIKNLGLEEYWRFPSWIVTIEWADKAENILPENALHIRFKLISKNKREISFYGESHWKKILNRLKKS